MAASNDYITNSDLQYFKMSLEQIYAKKNEVYDIEQMNENFLRKGEPTNPLEHQHEIAKGRKLHGDNAHDGFLSIDDKDKLDSIQHGANLYEHPATHPADMIIQDAKHRFVTDDFIAMTESVNKCRIVECSDAEYNLWLRTGMIDLNTLYMITGEYEGKQVISGMYFANKPYLGGYLPRYIPVERVVLDQTRFDVEAGSETWIGASIYPSNSSFRMLDYEIETLEGKDVIEIDKYGKITAKNKGCCYVTVRSQDNPGAFVIIMVNVSNASIRKMDIVTRNMLITAGYSAYLNVDIQPIETTSKNIYWTTSDRDIAVVNFQGKVTGIKPGKCNITGITTDGTAIKDTVAVEIIENIIFAKDINIKNFDTNIYLNEETKIEYSILPENATKKDIRLKSSNENVLSVDNINYSIIGKNIGTAILYIESADGSNIKKSYRITVRKRKIEVERIILFTIGDKQIGDIFNPSAVVIPYEADNTKINYSIIGFDEIETDQNGTFIAVKPGKVGIRATSVDNPSIYAEEYITINERETEPEITKFELEHKALILNLDDTITNATTIGVTIEPISKDNTDVYWKTSNARVVDVDYRGNIIAKNHGTAVLTCYSLCGNYSASCEVTVISNAIPVTNVLILTDNEKRIKLKEQYRLPVTVLPYEAADRSLTYKSSDSTIADVNEKGIITGLSVGKCDIIASSVSNPNKTATCKITVVDSYNDILVTDIRIANTIFDIKTKSQLQLIAIPLPINATNQELIWSSSNNNVASVNKDGLVTGKSAGICKIRVYNKASNVESVATITVLSENYNGDGVSSIDIAGPYISKCKPYSVFTQDFNTVPYSAKDNLNPLSVSSDFPYIAGTNGETIVCGSTRGFTVIRTEFDNNINTYLQLFVCNNLQLNSFRSVSDVITINAGKSIKPKFVYDPFDFPFDYTNLVYKVIKNNENDVAVVQINEDGTITGLRSGIATVEVTYSSMDYDDVITTINVYVIENNILIHENEMDIEVNGNIATLYARNTDYFERYLLYSEPLENDKYFEINDNGTMKYLKLTDEYTDSMFAFEDVLSPTSGIQPKLIPRYNFRYDISDSIHFRNNYITKGLIDTSITELQKVSDHIIFREDPESPNVVEEYAYEDTWNGLTESLVSKNGYVKEFEMSINRQGQGDTEKDIEIRKNITLHEFLHVLGFDDLNDEDQIKLNKNTILSYYRDKYLCNMLQPTELYTLADMYNFEMDVNDLNLGSGFKMSDTQIAASDNDLTRVSSFNYDVVPDELLEEKSDIAIVGFVDGIKTKKINIGGSKFVEYDVITLLVGEVIKGNVSDTIEIKIPIGKLNMELGENYELYLKEYSNVPASPLNLKNAIKKL